MFKLQTGAGAALLGAALLGSAWPAAAADVRFTITNDAVPGSVSWLLPEQPLPAFGVDDYFFGVEGPVAGTFEGAAEGDGLVEFEFFSFLAADFGGGLSSFAFIALDDGGPPNFNIPYGFELAGEQLFTGPTSAPTFRLGTFALVDTCFCGAGDYSLTISAVTAAVPEPATWAILILGFGAIGAALRSRRRILARS